MHNTIVKTELPTNEDLKLIYNLQQRIGEKISELHDEVDFDQVHDSFIFKTDEDRIKFERLAEEMKLNQDIFELHSFWFKRQVH